MPLELPSIILFTLSTIFFQDKYVVNPESFNFKSGGKLNLIIWAASSILKFTDWYLAKKKSIDSIIEPFFI